MGNVTVINASDLRRDVKLSGAAPLALALALSSAPAAAQEAASPAGSGPEPQTATFGASPAVANAEPQLAEAADIVVTGSRIARPELEASTPISVVNNAAIERTGQTNISEVLRRTPIFSTGTSSGNTNFSTAGNGVNTLDLRGLGEERTLVLINGKRVVAGLGGSSAVDINMIPTDLVERVETITGGASAIYGSDAMAGVVNFVLKDRFTGIDARAQNGISSRGDTRKYRLSATAGFDFGSDNAGNLWVNGVYDVDKGLLSADRSFSRNDVFGRSSFAPQGAFNLNGTIFDVTDVSGAGGNIYGNDYTFRNGVLQKGFVQNVDGFNRNGFRRLTVPVKRYLASAGLTYEFSDALKFYATGQYGRTKSAAQLEPYPAAGGDPNVDGAGSIDVVGGLRIDNPFIPAPIAAEIAARNSDGDPDNDVSYIAFRRRLNDVFNRSNHNTRNFYRAVVGLKGDILSGWSYDLSYVYGKTRDVTSSETVATDRFTSALDAVSIGGQIVCRDPAARAQGCQPLNLFGADTATQAAIDYVRRGGSLSSTLRSNIEQQVLSGSLSGTLFNLPAGDVKVAVGGEYRREKSSDDWDADTNAGNTLGNFLSDTRGKFNVKDIFGEIEVPIISEKPFFHYLGARGAVRYDDYSTIGGVLSWQAGAEWAPSRDIRFRGMYAQASRAPNISELFSAQSETFPGTLTLDPCSGVTATSSGLYDNACRSIAGVAAQIARAGSFDYSTVQIQSINGFDGGNPNLREETAKTITAGAVITPTFVRGLSLTIDYYRIKIAGAINSAPREDSVKACLLDPSSPSCALVFRLPTGYLTRDDAFNINTGGFLTSGIDVAANYQHDIGALGNISLTGAWTHLLENKRKPSDDTPYINELGQLQDTNPDRLGSGFRNRFTTSTSFSTGPATISWTARYFSPIKDTLDPETAPDPDINNVHSKFYNDFQAQFAVGESRRLEFYAGIDNAFDVKPPLLPNGLTASGQIGTETAQEYDVFGRYLYAGVRAKF